MPQKFISNLPVYAYPINAAIAEHKEETGFVTKCVSIKEIKRLLFEWNAVNSASIVPLYRAQDFHYSRNNLRILPNQSRTKAEDTYTYFRHNDRNRETPLSTLCFLWKQYVR
jgi:hypothetical protein